MEHLAAKDQVPPRSVQSGNKVRFGNPSFLCKGYPQFLLDTCPLRYVSATPAELIGFTLVCVLTSTRSAAHLLRPSSGSPEPSCTYTQDFYFWRMPEHDAAIQLNLAPSRQEVKQRNNNTTSDYFLKIKHSVLTPAHKSQKRDKHKLFC